MLYINRALENFDALISSRDLCHFNCKRHENCPTGELFKCDFIASIFYVLIFWHAFEAFFILDFFSFYF